MLVLLVSSAALAQGRRGEQRREQDKEEEKAPEGPVPVALGVRAPVRSADGGTIIEGTPRLDRLRDRIVVLLFFRTDDSSADSIAKVNEIHKKFQPLGVVVVGMTPQKKEAAEDVVKGKEIKFVVGYGVDTEDRYEVSSFPKVYLLDTAGRLATRFHPDDDLEAHSSADAQDAPRRRRTPA
jgi:peroxiredoxin